MTRQARACKEAQHRMAHQKRCWQVHSAVTPKVRQRKQRQDRVHAVCGKMTSGQLPFSGSSTLLAARNGVVLGAPVAPGRTKRTQGPGFVEKIQTKHPAMTAVFPPGIEGGVQ
jgi:hypothetical protein